MNAYRVLKVWALALLMAAAGCGTGGSGFNPDDVTVTVAPASVTIPAHGQAKLHATVKGDVSPGLVLIWSIAEDRASPTACTWNVGSEPPAGPCPGGTIQLPASDVGDFLTVTYFAPDTPGTFHVTAEWCLCGFGMSIIVDGMSAITVSP